MQQCYIHDINSPSMGELWPKKGATYYFGLEGFHAKVCGSCCVCAFGQAKTFRLTLVSTVSWFEIRNSQQQKNVKRHITLLELGI